MDAPEQVEPLDDLQSFTLRVTSEDPSWMGHAACSGAPLPIQRMLIADWKGSLKIDGERVSGRWAQRNVVETLCRTCPVQWECAHWRVVERPRTEGDDIPGVYGLTTADAGWLTRQPDPLSIILRARMAHQPVSSLVGALRKADRQPASITT